MVCLGNLAHLVFLAFKVFLVIKENLVKQLLVHLAEKVKMVETAFLGNLVKEEMLVSQVCKT